MTNGDSERLGKAPGLSRRLLALLVGLLAMVALIASGAPSAAAQNAVGAQPQNLILTVGPQAAAAPEVIGLHTVPQLRLASATGVAAETDGSRLAGSIRDVNPTAGNLNCVNCAVATDSTLAGAPASALPGGVSDIGSLERLYGGSFTPASGRGEISQMLSDAGPGARGIVYGSRADTYGHVFNGVNQGGTIRFLDGQSGGVANWEDGFDQLFFMRTN